MGTIEIIAVIPLGNTGAQVRIYADVLNPGGYRSSQNFGWDQRHSPSEFWYAISVLARRGTEYAPVYAQMAAIN